MGAMALGEKLTPNRAAGGGLVIAGIVLHALSRRPARS
jgi:drug/metabolite transporter (DMT)-like permease